MGSSGEGPGAEHSRVLERPSTIYSSELVPVKHWGQTVLFLLPSSTLSPSLKTHHCCRKFPSKVGSAGSASLRSSSGSSSGSSLCRVLSRAVSLTLYRAPHLTGKWGTGEEGRSKWGRGVGGAKPGGSAPASELRRAVKSGASSQWGALCLHNLARCCAAPAGRSGAMLGLGWRWRCGGSGRASAPRCLPCLCAEPPAATLAPAPRGCASALPFPISFHCSFSHPYSPPQIA